MDYKNGNKEALESIKHIINQNRIVLFMKGDVDIPRCGFSGVVVEILNNIGVEFFTVDVLQSEQIREGIKQYSDWPTIPQLYVNKEFIGGCDIVREMFISGELKALLLKNNV